MYASDFDGRLGLITCERGPPCTMAVDGHIEGYDNEGEVDEPSASVGSGAEKCGDN